MNTSIQELQAQQLSDEDIINRVLAGESRLYELIMRRYNARLFRIGMSIVNNDAEVEDLMQVAYIKGYENLAMFQKRSSFGTWLTRIMINECLHQLKKIKQGMTIELSSDAHQAGKVNRDAATPVNTLLNKELSNMLEQALVELPEKYRMVFVLREMENMSIAETVDTLNITEANVKVRLNRAKTMLRDTLGSYYKNEGIFHFHLIRCDRIVNNVLARIATAASH